MTQLAEWNNFYSITGSAAGTLIGLEFVALTLIAQSPALRNSEAGAAFATPTIVHFGAALFLSAILRVPWQTISSAAALWGLIGCGGVVYMVIVARHIRAQNVYQPDFEDWLFQVALPLAAYAILPLSALAISFHTRESLFGAGGATLLLVFIGIHNVWDAIAYNVFVGKFETDEKGHQDETSKKDTL